MSPQGCDTANGTLAAPFRTLHRARDAVRQLKAGSTADMAGPVSVVRVVLRAGVHYVGSEGLVLTPDDSGTAGGPVEYVAHPGEQVTISGGVAIPAEAWVPAMELSGAWKVNLTALGATELGNMSVPWEGAAPTDGLDTSGDTGVEWKDRTDKAELFYDSRPMVLARWPNIAPNGSWVWAHTHAQFPSNCTPHKEPMDPVPKFPSTSGCRGFTWRKDRPPPAKEHSWADAPDGFLHGETGALAIQLSILTIAAVLNSCAATATTVIA